MNSLIKESDFTPLKGSKGSLGINLSPSPIIYSPTNTEYYLISQEGYKKQFLFILLLTQTFLGLFRSHRSLMEMLLFVRPKGIKNSKEHTQVKN